jgi:prevent-host-death family protein
MNISAKEAKDRFGEVIETARTETVTVTRHSKPTVAVISVDRLAELEAIEDRYWLDVSRRGAESGFIGIDKSKAYIEGTLSAES